MEPTGYPTVTFIIPTFASEPIVEETPVQHVQTVLTVDWPGTCEVLLGEGVTMVVHNLLYVPHRTLRPNCKHKLT